MKRKLAVLVMTAVLAAGSLAGCGGLDGSETVAEFQDTKITANVVNFYARMQQAQYETYYASFMGDEMWAGEVSDGKTYEASMKESILNDLENMYILETHAAEYNVALTDEEKAAIEEAADAFSEGNSSENKEVVSGDPDTVKRVLELVTIQSKMFDAMTADVDTNVSDTEAAQKSMQYVSFSYNKTDEDGQSAVMTGEEKEELMETVKEFREGALDAEDFTAYAEEKGYTASTVTFDAETTSPSAELIKAADGLKEGEVTEIIEDTSACYVAKLTSLLDRDATDKEKESIVSQRRQEKYSSLCTEWKDALDIKVHDSVMKKIDFQKQGVTIKAAETGEDESE